MVSMMQISIFNGLRNRLILGTVLYIYHTSIFRNLEVINSCVSNYADTFTHARAVQQNQTF
jgi:hypothetical protein